MNGCRFRFFKPKALSHLGTFQDGGLHHNNPIRIAIWESRFLWPQRGDPDFALSLGTGANATSVAKGKRAPYSPVKDRFVSRIFKTFMQSMDGEKAWHDTINTISRSSKTRLHRLNLPIEDQYLTIDDVSNLSLLRKSANEFFLAGDHLKGIVDSIMASMFYFELERLPEHTPDGIVCEGNILCRMDLSNLGRRNLYCQLLDQCAFFVVNGQPVKAVEEMPKCVPPFSRRVTIRLSSPSDSICISIRHMRMCAHAISGLPRTLEEHMRLQVIEAPFGRRDHTQPEKSLPRTPSKRKSDIPRHWNLRQRSKRARYT